MLNELKQELEQIEAQGRTRTFIPTLRQPGQQVVYQQKKCLDFSDWDVFGLRWHPLHLRACHQSLEEGGISANSARCASGTSLSHLLAEDELAKFLGMDGALLFSSRNQALLSLVTALFREGDVIFLPDAAVSPLVDAAALCQVEVVSFSLRDLGSLQSALERTRLGARRGIFVDAIASGSGEMAPLEDLVRIALSHGAMTFIDESLSLGIVGGRGAGALEALKVRGEGICAYGSLGFVLGSYGAFIAGNETLCCYLRQRSRTFQSEPALPPAWCEALRRSLGIVEDKVLVRMKVQAWVQQIEAALHAAGFGVPLPVATPAPFLAIRFAKAREAREVFRQMLERGFLLDLDEHVAEPRGGGALRIIFQERHVEAQRHNCERALLETLDRKRTVDGLNLYSENRLFGA